jgi:hypothetical protein
VLFQIKCVVVQGIRPAEEVEAAAAAASGAFYSPAEVQAMDPKQVRMSRHVTDSELKQVCMHMDVMVRAAYIPQAGAHEPTQALRSNCAWMFW